MNERLRQWGLNLKTARGIKGWTQAELAERVGVKQASVSRWETGTVGPSDDDKVALAKELGQDVRMLFPLFAAAS